MVNEENRSNYLNSLINYGKKFDDQIIDGIKEDSTSRKGNIQDEKLDFQDDNDDTKKEEKEEDSDS